MITYLKFIGLVFLTPERFPSGAVLGNLFLAFDISHFIYALIIFIWLAFFSDLMKISSLSIYEGTPTELKRIIFS